MIICKIGKQKWRPSRDKNGANLQSKKNINQHYSKMKNFIFTLIIAIGLVAAAKSQVINQITISPTNPTENDTISIISNFTFYGNCSFGLLSYITQVEGSTITVIPFYCGHGDTTLCNSIDTFKIGIITIGNYSINIDYHQGSICPISGFDEIIAQFDTSLTVVGSSNISDRSGRDGFIKIYPNPADDYILIDCENFLSAPDFQLKITDAMGKLFFQGSIKQRQFFVQSSTWDSGMYFVSITDGQGNFIDKRKILMN